MDLRYLFLQRVHLLPQRNQVGKDRLHLLLDGPSVGKPAVLVQISDHLSVGQAHRAFLIVQPAGQHVEQGGFAFPVCADQSDAILFVDGGVDIPQDAVRAVIFKNMFE